MFNDYLKADSHSRDMYEMMMRSGITEVKVSQFKYNRDEIFLMASHAPKDIVYAIKPQQTSDNTYSIN